jgi:hypothetical protein
VFLPLLNEYIVNRERVRFERCFHLLWRLQCIEYQCAMRLIRFAQLGKRLHWHGCWMGHG